MILKELSLTGSVESDVKLLSEFSCREPADPCYLYFTSGSTGQPKGIAGQLASVEHFIDWEIRALQLGPGVRVSQLTGIGFDAYLRDLFVPLCAGGTMCIPADSEIRKDSSKLIQWLQKERIEVVHCVPTVLRSILQELDGKNRLPAIRYVLVAGEPLLPADVKQWYAVMPGKARLVNLYGATETTMTKFVYEVREHDAQRRSVPIGNPMPGAAALVVDQRGNPCPIGVIGEIWIRTHYRSHGYYGKPDLTAEKFMPNPFTGDPNDLVYRTGDLGRLLRDGTFEFIGRKDGLVKLRGNRIELGEIESVLMQVGARQAAVTVMNDRLVAYVVSECSGQQLRSALRNHLPEYMLPSAVIVMPHLPTTPNGKLDRKALPKPDFILSANNRPARTADELLLCDLFTETLGVEQVGLDDNFFELGGHSLMATRLLSRIRTVLGIEVAIQTLFECPTVGELARQIRNQVPVGTLFSRILPLRRKGDKPPLFCIPPAGGLGWVYSGLLRTLTPDRPIYCLQAPGIGTDAEFPSSVAELSADYISLMRQIHPAESYHLLGWSFGGLVAHTMACHLQREGVQVPFLAILDTYPELRPEEKTPEFNERHNSYTERYKRVHARGFPPIVEERVTKLMLHANELRRAGIPLGLFDGDVLFFAANESMDRCESWRPYVSGRFDVHEIHCTHEEIMDPRPVLQIGRIVDQYLRALGTGAKTTAPRVPASMLD